MVLPRTHDSLLISEHAFRSRAFGSFVRHDHERYRSIRACGFLLKYA